MASINYAFKEISCKIVYYGPGLCGKTTNLQSIHASVPAKYRGDLVSLATEQDRTLFFDFLPLDLGEVRGFKTKFQLYTVPGQVYYNATRKLVLRGVDGIVFVADSAGDRMEDNRDSLNNLRENLESYGLNLDNVPYVMQYNKRDLTNTSPCDEMEALLNPDRVPSFEAVATDGTGVRETLKGIAALVLRRLREMAEAGASSSLERKAAEAGDIKLARSQRVSLAEAAAQETRKTAGVQPAPKRTVAASPPPRRPPLAAAAAKGKPLPTRNKSTEMNLHVLQKCDVLWHGMRIGSAVVEVSRRANIDRKAPYALTCHTSVLGLLRGTWNALLDWGGEQTKVIDYRQVPFYVLKELDFEGRKLRNAEVWVKNAFDKACYVSYAGFGGRIRLVPAGRGWIGE